MRYRRLGKTDIEVSVICQGCWSLIGGFNWGPQDRRDSIAAIHASLDAGVNFYDTAPAYGQGESEQLLAAALGPRRKEVVLATKVSRSQLVPENVRRSCEASLRHLGTDTIDLLQIHWPNRDVPAADTLDEMTRLRDEGKIRAIGLSNFGNGYLEEALNLADVQCNQVAYNLLFRAVEHYVQPTCVARGVDLLCYSPLMQGLLTGKFDSVEDIPEDRVRTRHFSSRRPHAKHGQSGCEEELFAAVAKIRATAHAIHQPMGHVAMAWLLAQDGVASVLAGARNADQARDNALAGDLVLDVATVAKLSELSEPVKARLGESIDMWESDSRAERA